MRLHPAFVAADMVQNGTLQKCMSLHRAVTNITPKIAFAQNHTNFIHNPDPASHDAVLVQPWYGLAAQKKQLKNLTRIKILVEVQKF